MRPPLPMRATWRVAAISSTSHRTAASPGIACVGTGYRPRLTGENIAFGPESVEEVVAGWLASPGHCANIMDPRFREMGVAVALGRKRGHFYWVQDLGAQDVGRP